MAGVVDHDTARVIIKKEIEDTPESPEHTDVQDPPPNQPETNGSQKHSKASWGEDETRSLIELHKNYVQRFKDGNYSKRQLLEDVAQELNLIGYDTTPDKVRNKMKYLRTRYKGILDYNAKHVEKKSVPFQQELDELFSMEECFDDQEALLSKEMNGNGSSDISFQAVSNDRVSKRTKSLPASHVDLRTVVTTKKKNPAVSRATKILKKKVHKRAQPLFQCGLCMNKFKTSYDMHDHNCLPKTPTPKTNIENASSPVVAKKKQAANSAQIFHWNSLITMQFLDLLKEYQDSHKNSNFRKGNIWVNMSTLMKRLGYKIHPKLLAKKWSVLTTNFEKTVNYNNTHKDKKKCAFFKRLMELHNHPTSFDCFSLKNEPAKRTVEVSPFSFSQPTVSSSKSSPSPNCSNSKAKEDKIKPSNTPPDLFTWLNCTWTEYKEMERTKQELEYQRHNEIMEMLSYLIDSKDKH